MRRGIKSSTDRSTARETTAKQSQARVRAPERNRSEPEHRQSRWRSNASRIVCHRACARLVYACVICLLCFLPFLPHIPRPFRTFVCRNSLTPICVRRASVFAAFLRVVPLSVTTTRKAPWPSARVYAHVRVRACWMGVPARRSRPVPSRSVEYRTAHTARHPLSTAVSASPPARLPASVPPHAEPFALRSDQGALLCLSAGHPAHTLSRRHPTSPTSHPRPTFALSLSCRRFDLPFLS